jgi:hypothetical protein
MSQRRISRQALTIFSGLVFLLGIFVVWTHHAYAAQQHSYDPNAAAGLEISPALVQLNGEPGQSYILKERVTNVTKNNLNYSMIVDDFGAKDETGIPKLLPLGNLPPTASMISWVSAVGNFSLQSMQSKTLTITVNIPKNAEAGGHYGVIEFQGSRPDVAKNTVGVQASTGLLILTRVAGAINENLSLASLTAEKNGHSSSIFENGPITFVSRLHNIGNVHVAPTGTIEITDMFGHLVNVLKVNQDASNVLPNSIRRFESTLSRGWMFGRYTADLTIGYGTKGEVLQGEITFWVIPWKIVAAVIFVLATLIFVAWQLIKVYNRHIINKYKQTNDKQTKKPKKRKG